MIAFIILMVFMSAWLIATALNRTNAELSNERARVTRDSLQTAKRALIAYAAAEQWQVSRGESFKQPGALPCPDTDGDGSSEGLCSNAASRVGRIPWKNIGLDDLRDSSGEKLWYALSANFRKLPYPAGGYTVINSDTQGTLTVTGATPAANVVAIVFAPGPPLSGQSRDPSNSAAYNSPANYLEGYNASYNSFATATASTDTFNDRLVVITQQELMEAVEPVVAAMIERDVKPYITTYSNDWGYDASWNQKDAFPFPAKFADINPDQKDVGGTPRTQADYTGNATDVGTKAGYGLLPLTPSASYSWTAGSGSLSTVSGLGLLTLSSCADASGAWRCNFTIVGLGGFLLFSNLRFRLEGEIANAGLSFPTLPAVSDVTVTCTLGCSSSAVSLGSPTLKAHLSSSGKGTIAFEGTYSDCPILFCLIRSMQVTIPAISASKLTSPDYNVNPAAWFIANEWYRQTYYSVWPASLPGGSGSPCSPSCLTVNNLPPSYTTSSDKKAILVLAGRALGSASHPSSSLASYLEGENANGDAVFEHRSGKTTSINDRVVVLSP
jgi:hypothetical protein